MRRGSLAFLLMALVAGASGLSGVADAAAVIAKGLLFIAVVLFIATVIAGVAAGSSITHKLKLPSKAPRREDRHLSRR